MLKWIMEVISSTGYVGIIALMFIENVFPPIPSEFIIPLAGFMVSTGEFAFVGVVGAGTLGSTLGSLPLYYLGKTIDEKRLRRWIRRYGRWLAVAERDFDRSEKLFEKYGGWTVFFCRMIPGVRSLISLPAGVHRMDLFPFLLWSTAGMALWTLVLTSAGYLLRHNFERVEDYLDPFVYIIIGVVAAGYIYRIVKQNGTGETSG